MKFRKKDKPEKQKKEKIRIVRVGVRRKSTVFLWILLIGSVSFGIYKNFTAVDTRTEVVNEVIELKLLDTNGIENYVKNFAKVYYAWAGDKETLEKRTENINFYLVEALQNVNVDLVTEGTDTRSVVHDVTIWNVEAVSESDYDVKFSVKQEIISVVQKEVEGKKKKEITTEEVSAWQTNTYVVRVHMDETGNYVIVKNPTLSKMPEKSDYQVKEVQTDGKIDGDSITEITEFLQTFFMMYPQATDKELVYYVKNDALKPINGNYTFWEIVNPVMNKEDNKVRVTLFVKYYDETARISQLSQYDLTLEKNDNWKIVAAN